MSEESKLLNETREKSRIMDFTPISGEIVAKNREKNIGRSREMGMIITANIKHVLSVGLYLNS